MNLPNSIHEVVAKAPLAHLTTLNTDGAPQVTVVWVGIRTRSSCLVTWHASRK